MNPDNASVAGNARHRQKPAVRKVCADELPQVANTLARAFFDDPPTRWVIPDDACRKQRLEKLFHLWMRTLWLAQGECLTTVDHAGAAMWIPPGGWETPVLQQLLLLPGMALRAGRFTGRLLRAINGLESRHPHTPHFYLPFAGVIPARQGQGIGATLLTPVLERCDRDAVPAYLEASSPVNRRLYERHGFVVTEAFRFADDAPPLWRMWREPKKRGD